MCSKKSHDTFGGLPELQIDLMIAHWKYIFVFYTMDPLRTENDQVYPPKKSILPRMVKKKHSMAEEKRNVRLHTTFGGLIELQIELMIDHWKSLSIWLSLDSSNRSF